MYLRRRKINLIRTLALASLQGFTFDCGDETCIPNKSMSSIKEKINRDLHVYHKLKYKDDLSASITR